MVYVDPEETIAEQKKIITKFKEDGDRHFTDQGRVAEMTEMSENKVNGPEDAIACEMIKQLPQEKIYTITRGFQEQFTELEDGGS